MDNTVKTKINIDQVKAIEHALTNGDRVEIIPVKDGVKVVRVKRETIQDVTP